MNRKKKKKIYIYKQVCYTSDIYKKNFKSTKLKRRKQHIRVRRQTQAFVLLAINLSQDLAIFLKDLHDLDKILSFEP